MEDWGSVAAVGVDEVAEAALNWVAREAGLEGKVEVE